MDKDVVPLLFLENSESPEPVKIVSKTNLLFDKTEINEFMNSYKENLENKLISDKSKKKNNQMEIIDNRSQAESSKTQSFQIPDLVDLVKCKGKSPKSGGSNDHKINVKIENHSKTHNINIEEIFINKNCLLTIPLFDKTSNSKIIDNNNNNNNDNFKEPSVEMDTNVKIPDPSLDIKSRCNLPNINFTENYPSEVNQNTKNQTSRNNIFTDFLKYCKSLENSPEDRKKLVKKMNKCFIKTGPEYVRSEGFRNFIKTAKARVNKYSLYVAIILIYDLLKMWKNVKNDQNFECSQNENKSPNQNKVNNNYLKSLGLQKQFPKIQKLITKLNHQCLTKKLEEEKVYLSKEENSFGLKAPRFSESFWMIYKILCQFTNGLVTQKMHFSENENSAINSCLEEWLNKRKLFPDFVDIMKILHSKNSEFDLPPYQDSLRSLGTEVFQKLNNMSQIRRKHKGRNCLSGLLEESEGITLKNLEPEKTSKKNCKARIKKVVEVYPNQKKEALQPIKFLEDAYLSSISKKEIRDIGKKYEEIKDESMDTQEVNNADINKEISNDVTSRNITLKEKKSKNNFKTWKSLKHSLEKGGISLSNSPDVDVYSEQKTMEAWQKEENANQKPILKELHNMENFESSVAHQSSLSFNVDAASKKRSLPFVNENLPLRKKGLTENEYNNIKRLNKDEKNFNKTFFIDIGYCHVVTNYNFKERRKTFRDLTNLNRLMKEPGLRNKMKGLFAPSFLYSRYSFKKEAHWKKRFKVNLREIKSKNQECALNEEEKTNEKISSDSRRDSEDKEKGNNEGSTREGADFRSQGNGQEEDNNDKGDENKKNGKVEDENDDLEEDEDEEKEDENAELGEHSSNVQKTESENEDLLGTANNENHTLDDTKASDTAINVTCAREETSHEDLEKQGKQEFEEGTNNDEYFENSMDYEDESCGDMRNKSKDLDAEEFENFKNSLEPICVLKEEDSSDLMNRSNTKHPVGVQQNLLLDNMLYVTEKLTEDKKFRRRPFGKNILRTETSECSKNESYNQKRLSATAAWTPPFETSQPKPRKMSASDEERVKRFLLHSPSSISITPPKKLLLSKPPSQSALQALATLRNLKGISATIVKGKPKTEKDVNVIRNQSRGQTDQSPPVTTKKRRTDFPVISNVQSANALTPKIVTVQGNVSGFENLWPEMRNNRNTNSSPSSIRISKVWGSLPERIVQSNPSSYPSCSRMSTPGTSNPIRKKSKKQVEYVVLD